MTGRGMSAISIMAQPSLFSRCCSLGIVRYQASLTPGRRRQECSDRAFHQVCEARTIIIILKGALIIFCPHTKKGRQEQTYDNYLDCRGTISRSSPSLYDDFVTVSYLQTTRSDSLKSINTRNSLDTYIQGVFERYYIYIYGRLR
jgi:hypothetical protein